MTSFLPRQSRSFLRSRIKYSAPLYVGLVLFYTARFLTLLRGDPFTWVFQVMSAISTLMVPLAIFLSSQFLRATPIWDSLSAASKVMKSLSVLFDGFRQQHRLKFFKYPLDDLNERHWICGQCRGENVKGLFSLQIHKDDCKSLQGSCTCNSTKRRRNAGNWEVGLKTRNIDRRRQSNRHPM